MTDDLYTPTLGIDPVLIPISNSEIGTFKECKRKWYLDYYLGLGSKKTPTTGPLAFGTRIHKCLEDLYKYGVNPLETHQAMIEDSIETLVLQEHDTTDLMKDAELGRIMLEGYMEWLTETGADASMEIVGSEKKLSYPLMDGKVELRGKADLIVQRKTDQARSILDFKTVQNRTTYVNTAHIAEQLKLYLLLLSLDGEYGRVDGGIYRLLKKSKRTAKATGPFYEDYDVRHNQKTLESYWAALHGVITDMLDLRKKLDAGIDHRQVAYPTPNKDCSWKCPFYAACPMFDDGSAVDEYLEDKFEKHDPYQRYEESDET